MGVFYSGKKERKKQTGRKKERSIPIRKKERKKYTGKKETNKEIYPVTKERKKEIYHIINVHNL